MSYREKMQLRTDMISRKNTLDIEIRGKEDTIRELDQEIYKLGRKIANYEAQLTRSQSKTIQEMYQKNFDVHTSERNRLIENRQTLEQDVQKLIVIADELKDEIKRLSS